MSINVSPSHVFVQGIPPLSPLRCGSTSSNAEPSIVKEPTTSRPLSHHRVSSSSIPLNVPSRHSSGSGGHRQHAHSISLGSLHPSNANRVTRRKSLTANSLSAAMLHINDASLEALVSPESQVARRAGPPSRTISATSPPPRSDDEPYVKQEQSAGETETPTQQRPAGDTKMRNRRASEGSYLTKEAKRVSNELKCDKCGKGYKHSSCLTKHLYVAAIERNNAERADNCRWEHTPEWAYTSKLLISKHQQVQLLEAASVLVTMNQDLPAEMSTAIESDHSSASPEASGSSELLDDEPSSVETTPPPTSEGLEQDGKRFSNTSSMYSRSYQSVPGTSIAASSLPSSSYGSYHYTSRPSTSGAPYSTLPAEDEAGLAAAVKLVSFGTPRSMALAMDQDVPPVPPLPARYATHNNTKSTSCIDYVFSPQFPTHPLSHRISDERDTKMPIATTTSVDVVDLEERRSFSRGHSEHEDGFFGRMEE